MTNSLSGARVLVTGADGFIGSHLVEALVAAGAQTRALCLYNSQGTWGWLETLTLEQKRALDVRLGDIRDARFVEELVSGIDIVFHLAALISIPYSYHAPQSFIDTNVSGTLNVLEACRRHRVKRLVHTSTSEVYGTPRTVPIREDHLLHAQSPYAASKVAADQLTLSYQASFDVPAVVLRPFNTFGPRQSTRAVLPTILTQLIAGVSELKLGRLDTKRDMTFVSDTVDGFLRAATATDIAGLTIQLGTGRTVSIADMVDIAQRVTGNSAKVVTDERRLRPDASEVLVLLSDPAQAQAKLGWSPRVSLEDGIRQTANWLKANASHYKTDFLHV
jgi:UDP-glucose 4-epimerase